MNKKKEQNKNEQCSKKTSKNYTIEELLRLGETENYIKLAKPLFDKHNKKTP